MLIDCKFHYFLFDIYQAEALMPLENAIFLLLIALPCLEHYHLTSIISQPFKN